MRALRKLTLVEFKLFLREPLPVFFAVAFPAILIAILGGVQYFRQPQKGLGGLRIIDLYVGISITLVLGMLALQFLPVVMAGYREKGILRRLSTTPVSPVFLLIAQLISITVIMLISVVLVIVVGRLAYAVALPRQALGFLVALLLCAVALFAMGLFVAAVAPTSKAGNAIGSILFFPVMFFAGLWLPREGMPPLLRDISDYTPLGAGEQALHDTMAGAWPQVGSLTVLVAYIVIFGAAAAKFFRWD